MNHVFFCFSQSLYKYSNVYLFYPVSLLSSLPLVLLFITSVIKLIFKKKKEHDKHNGKY